MTGPGATQTRDANHRLALDDPQAIALFRDVLARAKYTETEFARMVESESKGGVRLTDATLINRVLPKDGLLPALLRLFVCVKPADPSELARLIKPMTVDQLQSLGLVRVANAGVEACVRMIPLDDMVLTSEFLPGDKSDLPPDFVMGLNPTSVALAKITVRRPVKTALDLGTGTGVQSMLASRHCERIVATDLNPRAVNFAAFNCLLNGITNVECRQGSLFEPVAKESFDLIVCNPPFVVSPDKSYQFRDSGHPLDSFCKTLVEGMPRHLNEGGFAEILCCWVLRDGEEWQVPPRGWIERSECDALIFHTTTETPLAYAASWNRPIQELHPARFEAALDRWTEHFTKSNVGAIASGGIVLRRRSGASNWAVAMDVLPDRDEHTGAHILRMFEAGDWLSRPASDEEVLQSVFRPSPDVQVNQSIQVKDGRLAPSGMGAALGTGFRFRGDVDVVAGRLLLLLDGKLRLAEIVEKLRESIEAPVEKIRTRALAVAREFYGTGFIVRS